MRNVFSSTTGVSATRANRCWPAPSLTCQRRSEATQSRAVTTVPSLHFLPRPQANGDGLQVWQIAALQAVFTRRWGFCFLTNNVWHIQREMLALIFRVG